MNGYAQVENTTDLRTGRYSQSYGGHTIKEGEALIVKAQRTRAYTIISDTVDDNGNRIVEYTRKHPMDKCRITLHVQG